ncbi:hypothetical protein BJX99DRAFT_118301 [Aspergillus californicus]
MFILILFYFDLTCTECFVKATAKPRFYLNRLGNTLMLLIRDTSRVTSMFTFNSLFYCCTYYLLVWRYSYI